MVNRREFLALAAGAAAFTGLAGAGKKERILFGACRSSVEDVKAMRELGYDFWEWGAGSAFDPSKGDDWWRKQKDEIAKRPLPLRSCNGFIPGKYRLTGPKAKHGPALDYAETILRRADEVGVQTIVLGSGGARNLPKDWVKSDPAAAEKGLRQFTDFCVALAKRVADLKTVQVVIEPLRPKESNLVNFVWQGMKIVKEVNSPRIQQLASPPSRLSRRVRSSSTATSPRRVRASIPARTTRRCFCRISPRSRASAMREASRASAVGARRAT